MEAMQTPVTNHPRYGKSFLEIQRMQTLDTKLHANLYGPWPVSVLDPHHTRRTAKA